jgi:hypothetical protein
VDIDLNYIGALDREEMLAERPKIEQAAQAVFSREGFSAKRVPDEHAGGKWRLSYQSFTGQSGNLEVDMNFMFRQPLWDFRSVDSHRLGDFQSKGIPVLDIHELAAGKPAALLARGQARDLFDCHRILSRDDLEQDSYSSLVVGQPWRCEAGWRRCFEIAYRLRARIPNWIEIGTIFICWSKPGKSPWPGACGATEFWFKLNNRRFDVSLESPALEICA